MGYVPAGKKVSHWQSEAPSPGPVRSNPVQAMRSGSGRSFAPAKSELLDFSRSGQVLQQTTGQYGNYLLYKQQVAWANEHLQAKQAHAQDQELQQAVGVAATSMLGGPPPGTKGGPGKGRGGLGPPRPSSGSGVGPAIQARANPGGLTTGAPVQPFAKPTPTPLPSPGAPVQPYARGPQDVSAPSQTLLPNSQLRAKRPTAPPGGMAGSVLPAGVSGIVGGTRPEQLQMDFSQRLGSQPVLNPGNTTTPTETYRKDARAARNRGAGMNTSPTRRDPLAY